MGQLFINSVLLSVITSVIAYTYSEVLIRKGEVLHGFYMWYRKWFVSITVVKKAKLPEELGHSEESYSSSEVESKWLKPLGGCSKCTAGQLCLWLFLILSIHHNYYVVYGFFITIVNHVFSICLAILTTRLMSRIKLLN